MTIYKTKHLMQLTIILALLTSIGANNVSAIQVIQDKNHHEQVNLGHGMSMVLPNLIEVAVRTNFFLLLTDRVQMTNEQKSKLADIAFDFQLFAVQKQSDYDVSNAELMRILIQDTVDMLAVRAKVKEIETLNADLNIKKYESLLKAIGVLTHEQHLKIVVLSRTLFKEKVQESERIF
jgi:hypothetical protein